jgi:hypothetical protein
MDAEPSPSTGFKILNRKADCTVRRVSEGKGNVSWPGHERRELLLRVLEGASKSRNSGGILRSRRRRWHTSLCSMCINQRETVSEGSDKAVWLSRRHDQCMPRRWQPGRRWARGARGSDMKGRANAPQGSAGAELSALRHNPIAPHRSTSRLEGLGEMFWPRHAKNFINRASCHPSLPSLANRNSVRLRLGMEDAECCDQFAMRSS